MKTALLEPTGRLRWAKTGDTLTLQQEWKIVEYEYPGVPQMSQEWRPIPIVDIPAPSVDERKQQDAKESA